MFGVQHYFGKNIIILSCWSVNNWAVYYFFGQTVKGKAVNLATTKFVYISYILYHDVYRSNIAINSIAKSRHELN